MSLRRIATVFTLTGSLALPTLAAAQPALAERGLERHGLFAGGGVFGGNISCEGDNCGDFREAGGANGQVGYLLGPRFGLLLDVWAMTSSQNDISITYVASTLSARLWVAPRLWVQAGLGSGHAEVRVSIFGARGDDVPVGEVAAGAELVRGPGWSLDLTARIAQGTATSDNNNVTTGRAAGLGVTMTWYARQPARRIGMMASR